MIRIINRSLNTVKDLLPATAAAAPADAAPRVALSRPRTPPPPAAVLQIACPDPTAEDRIRDSHQQRGQFLARQERWDELADEMMQADADLAMTPSGLPVADLLSFGARADVVQAAEHALLSGKPAPDAPLMAGIEALEHILAEMPDSLAIACIVAQAHMDMGWAWRGNGWDIEVPARNRDAFAAHFDRAADILGPFEVAHSGSQLYLATSCSLLAGVSPETRKVADRYAELIDVNPNAPRAMRSLGNHLLPRWHGGLDQLEIEARRTAARTQDEWGAGGYTWVMFDAIAIDDDACARLDLPFFVEGLQDILEHHPDPYTVNLLAAYCANTMAHGATGNDEADQNRSQIAACADWIVRDHLTELHPMIWAHAARGFDNALRVRCADRFAAAGRDDALRILMGLFRREIESGHQIVFTKRGAIAQPI